MASVSVKSKSNDTAVDQTAAQAADDEPNKNIKLEKPENEKGPIKFALWMKSYLIIFETNVMICNKILFVLQTDRFTKKHSG